MSGQTLTMKAGSMWPYKPRMWVLQGQRIVWLHQKSWKGAEVSHTRCHWHSGYCFIATQVDHCKCDTVRWAVCTTVLHYECQCEDWQVGA